MQTVDVMYDIMGIYKDFETRIIVYKGLNSEQIYFDSLFNKTIQSPFRLPFDLEKRTHYRVKVEIKADDIYDAEGFFETGKMGEPFQGFPIRSSEKNHDRFVKSFHASKHTSGRLYGFGLGLYHILINGQTIHDEFFMPGINDYENYIQIQTYDITPFLLEHNTIEVELADGWYRSRFGLNKKSNIYGDYNFCHFEIRIGETVIPTDATWEAYPNKIQHSGIYDGESRDERIIGSPVAVVECPLDTSLLMDRISPKIVIKKLFKAVNVIKDLDGYILDFGQNISGFVNANHIFEAGRNIRITHFEHLQDGVYLDNLRTVNPVFEFISNGFTKPQPRFSYYGFRYVKIVGIDVSEVDLFEAALIHSDLYQTGHLSTSNLKLNQLIKNVIYTHKNNWMDVPTDCPQRDERLGWTGDNTLFCPTAILNMDSKPFYKKYLKDIRYEQLKMNKAVPNYAPAFKENPGTSAIWGDVVTILNDELFNHYEDIQFIEHHYPMMKDWITYLKERNPGYLYERDFQFGDWLGLDGVTEQSYKGGTDDVFIASMYRWYSTKIVLKYAKYLNYTNDIIELEDLCNNIESALLHEYITPSGRLALDTQTAYVLAIKMGLGNQPKRHLSGLLKRLEKDQYRLKTGIVGTAHILSVLSDHGQGNLAYHLLLQEDHPGWMYQINLGATTLWERWNSLDFQGKMTSTGMNSLNHYLFGTVLHFLYSYLLGYKKVDNKIQIEPLITPFIPMVEGRIHTNTGYVEVKYHWTKESVYMTLIVPPFQKISLNISGSHLIINKHVNDSNSVILTAGKYEITYNANVSNTSLNMESPFSFLMMDEGFRLMIQKISKPLFNMYENKQMELLNKPVGVLLNMPFLHIEDEIKQTIIEYTRGLSHD